MILLLQYLRGIAAMMVVYFHSAEQLRRVSGLEPGFPATLGSSGVDIFFVISGFIMWVTTADGRTTAAAFIEKRLIRIVPMYWLSTLCIGAAAFLAPSLLSSTRFDTAHVLASFGFIPWPHPVIPGRFPIIIPGWSINYEMAFYVVFAGALLLPRPARLAAILTGLCGAALAGWLFPLCGAVGFYAHPIILEFGAGVAIGAFYTARAQVSVQVARAAAVLGAILLVALGYGTDLPRVIAAGVPAALIVSGLAFVEKSRPVPLVSSARLLGDASYSIYVTHVVTLPVVTKAWVLAGVPVIGGFAAAFTLAGLFTSAIVGSLAYLLMERPLMRTLRRPRPPQEVGRHPNLMQSFRSAGGLRRDACPTFVQAPRSTETSAPREQ
jgi:exopolysaccharide production protein ExoZ